MALILTRRIGESIMIGDNIKVTIVQTRANEVRIGVTAPRSVVIDREEIHERKERERALS